MAAAKLARYQQMRDFEKTAEPSGKGAKALASPQLRFVIQKHAATRLHYDLRLEHEGVFLSWAVTRGPSFDPADKRLAVEVEPHPLDYGDFEGTIPKGQYGGGTVMLWDRGYWAPEPGVDIAKAIKKGDLKFLMEGEKMHGSWALVRMKRRPGEKRDNWLLIKHQDGYSADGDGDAVLAKDRSVASGRGMEDIAAGEGKAPTPFMTARDFEAGAVWQSRKNAASTAAASPKLNSSPALKARGRRTSEAGGGGSGGRAFEGEPRAAAAPSTASRSPSPAKSGGGVKSGTLPKPKFIEPQFCKLVDRPPQGSGWAHEIKFDGYRVQAWVSGGKATVFSRRGLDWTDKFGAAAKAAAALPDGVYDGEIVALDEHGHPDFAGLQAALSDEVTDDLILFAFDMLFDGGEDIRKLPLTERKGRLKTRLAGGGANVRYVDHFVAAGDAVLQSACRMDLEGIVSKRLDGAYRSGRDGSWTKAKCRAGQEVVIGGYTTTGQAFRSLVAGVYRDGKLIHVGRIGTGYGRDTAARLLPRLKALETENSPFHNGPRRAANMHWVRPDLVAEIAFAGFTGEGSLRQASFKGLREDKPAQDVSAEAPAPAEDTQLAQPAPPPVTPAKNAPSVVMGVSLSNPDKPLWPNSADQDRPVTKLELARYFETVADWIMPHIKGRPCSIIRIPDGLGQEQFFQRHAGRGTSALFDQVEVTGDHKPYLMLNRPEAMIAGAQMGAAELHPWNCQPGAPEIPGRFVFDLDPGEGTSFEDVIEAAREIRDRLDALGLVAFAKTTGGKGLHVVTPLKPSKIGWDEAKAFTRDVCAQMAADSPERYVINMSKKLRGGRIFLDYLRNDRMSTAAAVLSPRAREGATVSFPLNWTQVKKGLDPKAYTIRTAPALLAKTTAWADWCDSERDLAAAMKRLG